MSGQRDKLWRFKQQWISDHHIVVDDIAMAEQALCEVPTVALEGYLLYERSKEGRAFREQHGCSSLLFSHVWDAYLLDRQLKNFLFDDLAQIELRMRTYVGYALETSTGEFGYLQGKYFKSQDYHRHFLEDVELEKRRANEPYVAYYQKKHEGKLPVQVAVDMVSFGTLSKLYANMPRQMQKIVQDLFAVRSEQVLVSFFQSLTRLRNTCAHHGRLLDRNFPSACAILREDERILAKHGKTASPYKLYRMVVAMGHLLHPSDREKMKAQFDKTWEDFPSVQKERAGFMEEWDVLL